MKFFLAFGLLFGVAAPAAQAYHFTCDRTCEAQCQVETFLGKALDNVCHSACLPWQAAKCFNLSDPVALAAAEVGRRAYPSAAATMENRHTSFKGLNTTEMKFFKKHFDPAWLTKVRLHWGAQLMDKIGEQPFMISVGNSLAQTYGFDIYVRAKSRQEMDLSVWYLLLAHELVHTRQFVGLGESLEAFGEEYFRQFAKYGLNYNSNPMEREAERMASSMRAAIGKYLDKIYKAAPWHFEVCNNTGYEKIMVAVAAQGKPDGLTLVPLFAAKGWAKLKRGQCKTLVKDNPSNSPIFAFATSSLEAKGHHWSGQGEAFCVKQSGNFAYERFKTDCPDADAKLIQFKSFPNPHNYQQPKQTWKLTGKNAQLKVCNKTTQPIRTAILLKNNTEFESAGWLYFRPGDCTVMSFYEFSGGVYLYGEGRDATTVWQDPSSKINFCVHPGRDFGFTYGLRCPLEDGAKTVWGIKKTLGGGLRTFDFMENQQPAPQLLAPPPANQPLPWPAPVEELPPPPEVIPPPPRPRQPDVPIVG